MSDFADRANSEGGSDSSVPRSLSDNQQMDSVADGDRGRELSNRLISLLRLTQEVRAESDLETIFDRICSIARDLLGWQRVILNLVDEETGQRVRPVAAAGLSTDEYASVVEIADRVERREDWRDERCRISRSYFFDHRIEGGLSERPYFLKLELGDRTDDEWHEADSLVVPIEAGDQRLGALVVDDPEDRKRPTLFDIEQLEVLADQAAAAISSARLQARLRATAREAEALFKAATLLVDSTDLDRLLEKILDAIDEHFGHTISTVHLRVPESDILELRAWRGFDQTQAGTVDRVSGPGIVARVCRTGRLANVADVENDPDYYVSIPSTRAELVVPLMIDGEVIGVINVESPETGTFSSSDERILTSFAEQAAVAVKSAQLHERMRNQAGREALINSIISAIHRSSDLDEILQIPCEGLAKALNVERAYVAVVDWNEKVARFVHTYSADDSDVFTGSFPLSAMPELSERLWRGEAVAAADAFSEPILEAARCSYERYNTRAVVYQPVVQLGDWHAVLLVCSSRERRWTPDELGFIKTVAEQMGTAFVQVELFERVSQAKREWELTFDAMSDGVLLVDTGLRVYGANAAAGEMLRMRREDIIGRDCCELIAPAGGGDCPIEASIKGATRLHTQMVPERIGRLTQLTVDPIADGKGAVAVLRDVSEIRRAEADARRQSVILSQLVSSATDQIAMIDGDGTIVWLNQALVDAAGLADIDAGAPRFVDILSSEVRATAEMELERALAGEPRFFETAVTSADGSDTWMLVTLTPVFDDTSLAGVLVIGRDITGHRRAAERAAEADKLRALGQLSSGVAHNFNNALSVILGRTQLLKRRLSEPMLVRDLEIIEQVSHEAASTVRRIQNFARRRLHESFDPIDLRMLVADTIEMTSTRWRSDSNAHGVRYNVRFDARAGDYAIRGNDSELREVFVNLIFNALDAMPKGGSLSVTMRREGVFVVVEVSDTGTGMTDDVQRRVFEPFFTTKGAKGTGLGLPVSYGIVSRHDGRIEVETEPGHGTTFSVSLPAISTRAVADEMARTVHAIGPPAHLAEIVVVDDDSSVAEMVAEALRDRGHGVRSATDGREALELLENREAGVLVTDLSMPEINGMELASEVRERWPSMRIVLMTGADLSSLGDVPIEQIGDFTLTKPFEIDELVYLVESAAGLSGKKEGG